MSPSISISSFSLHHRRPRSRSRRSLGSVCSVRTGDLGLSPADKECEVRELAPLLLSLLPSSNNDLSSSRSAVADPSCRPGSLQPHPAIRAPHPIADLQNPRHHRLNPADTRGADRDTLRGSDTGKTDIPSLLQMREFPAHWCIQGPWSIPCATAIAGGARGGRGEAARGDYT